MLEHDVRELPQQVVAQHEAAWRGSSGLVDPEDVVGGVRTGAGPPPIQTVVRPHASARRDSAARRRRSRAERADDVAGAGEHADRRRRGRSSGTCTAGSARLPTMTGCTNSTATCWAWNGQRGDAHHIVAPAAKRRASARAATARSSARGSTVMAGRASATRAPRRPVPARGRRRSVARCDASTPRSHARRARRASGAAAGRSGTRHP